LSSDQLDLLVGSITRHRREAMELGCRAELIELETARLCPTATSASSGISGCEYRDAIGVAAVKKFAGLVHDTCM